MQRGRLDPEATVQAGAGDNQDLWQRQGLRRRVLIKLDRASLWTYAEAGSRWETLTRCSKPSTSRRTSREHQVRGYGATPQDSRNGAGGAWPTTGGSMKSLMPISLEELVLARRAADTVLHKISPAAVSRLLGLHGRSGQQHLSTAAPAKKSWKQRSIARSVLSPSGPR